MTLVLTLMVMIPFLSWRIPLERAELVRPLGLLLSPERRESVRTSRAGERKKPGKSCPSLA